MVMVIVADFVLFEVFVMRAVAPALPRSVLNVAFSKRNDLLDIPDESFDASPAGFLEPPAATQIKVQVSFYPPTVTVCPAFVHLPPAVFAA